MPTALVAGRLEHRLTRTDFSSTNIDVVPNLACLIIAQLSSTRCYIIILHSGVVDRSEGIPVTIDHSSNVTPLSLRQSASLQRFRHSSSCVSLVSKRDIRHGLVAYPIVPPRFHMLNRIITHSSIQACERSIVTHLSSSWRWRRC